MLIRLENGDWVDPRTVTAITSEPSIEKDGTGTPEVQVHAGAVRLRFDAEDFSDTFTTADRVAARVNEALEGKPC